MCSIDLHIIRSYLFRIILDSNFVDEIQRYMVIHENKCTGSESCNKFIRLFNGHATDGHPLS